MKLEDKFMYLSKPRKFIIILRVFIFIKSYILIIIFNLNQDPQHTLKSSTRLNTRSNPKSTSYNKLQIPKPVVE